MRIHGFQNMIGDWYHTRYVGRESSKLVVIPSVDKNPGTCRTLTLRRNT